MRQSSLNFPGDLHIRFSKIINLLCLVMPVQVLTAATIDVSLAELDQAIVSARDEPDAIQRLVLDKIQQRLDQADLQFVSGELVYQNTITDQLVEDGCTSTRIQRLQIDIALTGDTTIEFSFNTLFEPLRLSLDLDTAITSFGRARQVFGFRLGDCVAVASDSFDFAASGPVRLQLSLVVDLNPEWISDDKLRIRPEITIDGELREGRIDVSVDDTVLRGILEDFLQDEVNQLIGAGRVREEIANLQAQIDEQLRDSLDSDPDSDAGSGFIDVKLPAADDEQILALYELLTPQSRFPLTEAYLRSHRLELLAALILDDQDAVAEITSNAAECELGGVLQTSLSTQPVYGNEAGMCVNVNPPLLDGRYFGDRNCQQPFDFYATGLVDFCQVSLDTLRLGNPQSYPDQLSRWTLSPGSKFDLGSVSLSGKKQPYVQRQNFKTAFTAAGECQLEMRVYTDQPGSIGKKVMIALHGGSWQRRGVGFLGVENMATHFVDQGFVVFAPFYRLVGDTDGTAACHNASLTEILEDVNDALDWVNGNAAQYGAAGKAVVFGQSAGGHLALSLAARRSAEIERAVLFYAPTDFGDFIDQVQSGEYSGAQGQRILASVMSAASLSELSQDTPLVRENSYPAIIAAAPSDFPPVFIMHGESDSLLPFRQSVRLCNAMSGDIAVGPASTAMNTESVSRAYNCDDRGSRLHLIAEGEHTLDLCISDELCLAGSPASAAAMSAVIDDMLVWAAADSLPALIENQRVTTGAGGFGWQFLLLLPGCWFVIYFVRTRVGWRRKA